MNPTIKNIIISLIISAFAYLAISTLHPNGPTLPASIPEWLSLGVIFLAALFASFLSASPQAHYSSAGSYAETGTVKWFNVKKGYGFITRDEGDDIFVHYRNLQGSGRRTISEGQRVEFVVIDGDKGLQADEVQAI